MLRIYAAKSSDGDKLEGIASRCRRGFGRWQPAWPGSILWPGSRGLPAWIITGFEIISTLWPWNQPLNKANGRHSLSCRYHYARQAQSALLNSNIHDAAACVSRSKEVRRRIWPHSAAAFGVWSHDSGFGANAHSGGGGTGRFPMWHRRAGTDLQRSAGGRSFFRRALCFPKPARDLHKGGRVRFAGILAVPKAFVVGSFSLLAGQRKRGITASGGT